MAGGAAKKLAESNKRRLQLSLLLIWVPALVHATIRIGVFWRSATMMVIAKPVAALLINLTIYQRLSAAAMMEMDLKDYTLQNDAIYLGVAAQVLGCVTDWAWWLYAVIPLYLVWHGGKFLLSLWPKPKAEVTEEELAREEKREKRRQRRAQKFI